VPERQAPERLECPYIDTCTAPVTQQQYEAYCKELALTPHQPNYLACPAYQKLEVSPRAWKRRMETGLDNDSAGAARRR
jgi:hypothetical protein